MEIRVGTFVLSLITLHSTSFACYLVSDLRQILAGSPNVCLGIIPVRTEITKRMALVNATLGTAAEVLLIRDDLVEIWRVLAKGESVGLHRAVGNSSEKFLRVSIKTPSTDEHWL